MNTKDQPPKPPEQLSPRSAEEVPACSGLRGGADAMRYMALAAPQMDRTHPAFNIGLVKP